MTNGASPANSQLGRLEQVDPRKVFLTEAGHFTPWLAQAENLLLLGDAIGLDLELEAQERSVGPFRADILCKETTSGNWVLIENQLERTDHSHLGQLLTYAAGLDAVTIVWIAHPFTDEHRAALDWLNRITDKKFSFFGLELELWKIGNSPVAPKFNIVCQPNDWSKIIEPPSELGPGKQLQLRYWTSFRDFVLNSNSNLKPTKPLPQNWMNISIGRTGVKLGAIAALKDSAAKTFETNEIRAELVLDGENAKANFEELSSQRVAIQQALGYELQWYSADGVRMRKAFVRRAADLRDEADWPNQHAWLLRHLEDLDRVLRPLVLALP